MLAADAHLEVGTRRPAAHGTELPDKHDFLTVQLPNNEVVLVRQADGQVRGFVNTCRHRGARLVTEDRGRSRFFSCRYHGWAYAADGSLRAIADEPTLTEEAYADEKRPARHRVLEIAKGGGTPVICTQGKVIPDLIAWWCDRDGVRPDKSRNRKGSTWVLSLSGDELVAADHIGSPLPVG